MKIVEFLENLIEKLDRGSLIIYGIEGIGKFFTLKNIIIKKNKNYECLIIEKEEKFLQIDIARFLVNLAKYHPKTKRVVIINDAHKFVKDAQNTFLKTLEEPLSKTIFILITHRINQILPTIRSRSIIIKFPIPSKEETEKILKNYGFSIKDIDFILNFYPNQPGKAIKILKSKEKLELLKNFFTLENEERLALIEKIKEIFDLKEFLELIVIFEINKIKNTIKNKESVDLKKTKELMNLYFDADYFLNTEIQLGNLVLNYG